MVYVKNQCISNAMIQLLLLIIIIYEIVAYIILYNEFIFYFSRDGAAGLLLYCLFVVLLELSPLSH